VDREDLPNLQNSAEATDIIQPVIHTLNGMSAILYGSIPYISGSYFLASGGVTDRGGTRAQDLWLASSSVADPPA
jgi:hypothetical protein